MSIEKQTHQHMRPGQLNEQLLVTESTKHLSCFFPFNPQRGTEDTVFIHTTPIRELRKTQEPGQ